MIKRHIRTTLATGVAAFALVTGLAACGGDAEDTSAASADAPAEAGDAGEPTGAGDTVTIKTFIYSPNPVTVPAGTTVRWEQLDGTTHSVTAGTRDAPEPDVFDADLAKGETFEHTFDEPGTYDYFCTFHNGPGMTGQVVVE